MFEQNNGRGNTHLYTICLLWQTVYKYMFVFIACIKITQQEFTRFTQWMQNSARRLPTFGPSRQTWATGPPACRP